ncbi:MAG: isopentenyl phosphate kinase [Candidatus Aenigmatarchaeota archaeon]
MKGLKMLKIGGSVITEKDKDEPSPDIQNMERVAEEISKGLEDSTGLVLIHGAGSYGHPIVKRTEIHKGLETDEDKVNFAKTQRLQNELNSIFTQKLIEEDLPAFPVQASASAVMDDRLKKMNVEVVRKLVGIGVIPVLYGVPAYDENKGCSILSGDEIMPYLADRLGVDTVLHGTNVDGIYTSDPRKSEDAELIRKLESWEQVEEYLGDSKDTDVTGGMLNKVKKIMDVGVRGRIFDVSEEGNLEKVLRGEDIGTLVEGD